MIYRSDIIIDSFIFIKEKETPKRNLQLRKIVSESNE